MTNGSACGGDQAACDCDDGCGPSWSFQLGDGDHERSDPNAFPIFTNGVGTTLVDAADYDFEYRAGIDFGAIRHIDDDWAVDFRYFGIDSWTAAQTNALTPTPVLSTPVIVIFPGYTTADSTYGSNLYSTEFNLRRKGEWLTTFVGYRYVELNEDLEFLLGPSPTIYRESTDNRMHGFQFGAEANVWNNGSRFRLDSWIKAGIYYDLIRHRSQIGSRQGIPSSRP